MSTSGVKIDHTLAQEHTTCHFTPLQYRMTYKYCWHSVLTFPLFGSFKRICSSDIEVSCILHLRCTTAWQTRELCLSFPTHTDYYTAILWTAFEITHQHAMFDCACRLSMHHSTPVNKPLLLIFFHGECTCIGPVCVCSHISRRFSNGLFRECKGVWCE